MITKLNKRAQISDTLTWIIATLIIFFIMFFFVAIVSLWAAKEKITFSEIRVTKEAEEIGKDLMSSKTLMYLMSIPINYGGEETSIKELIIKWASGDEKAKNEIENKIKEKLDGLLDKDKGYLFYVAYSEKNKEIKEGIYGGGFIQIDGADDYISLSNNFYLYGVTEEAKHALESAATIYLISDKNIKIRLFIGKSKWEE